MKSSTKTKTAATKKASPKRKPSSSSQFEDPGFDILIASAMSDHEDLARDALELCQSKGEQDALFKYSRTQNLIVQAPLIDEIPGNYPKPNKVVIHNTVIDLKIVFHVVASNFMKQIAERRLMLLCRPSIGCGSEVLRELQALKSREFRRVTDRLYGKEELFGVLTYEPRHEELFRGQGFLYACYKR